MKKKTTKKSSFGAKLLSFLKSPCLRVIYLLVTIVLLYLVILFSFYSPSGSDWKDEAAVVKTIKRGETLNWSEISSPNASWRPIGYLRFEDDRAPFELSFSSWFQVSRWDNLIPLVEYGGPWWNRFSIKSDLFMQYHMAYMMDKSGDFSRTMYPFNQGDQTRIDIPSFPYLWFSLGKLKKGKNPFYIPTETIYCTERLYRTAMYPSNVLANIKRWISSFWDEKTDFCEKITKKKSWIFLIWGGETDFTIDLKWFMDSFPKFH